METASATTNGGTQGSREHATSIAREDKTCVTAIYSRFFGSRY